MYALCTTCSVTSAAVLGSAIAATVEASEPALLVTPARRGKGNKSKATNETQDQTPAEKRGWPRPASRPVPGLTSSMTW
ncbi:MAG: hypothetical protein QNK19_01805, partial [Xanthomonadales bacterium]|nr:hypothetical protein [Xanthomonadales bacterium]